jgi:hypothetical protein
MDHERRSMIIDLPETRESPKQNGGFMRNAGIRSAALLSILFTLGGSTLAHAARYEVTITNLTPGQQFTPFIVATHSERFQLFTLGKPARPELATLAAEGDFGPLQSVLEASSAVRDIEVGDNTFLTNPGASTTFFVETRRGFERLTLAAMLVPTNDAFLALNGIDLSQVDSDPVTHFSVAYDGGTEQNDELCASIPGPDFAECSGAGGGAQAGNGEGFVHVHSGIHGVGDLIAAKRTWLNPVAAIKVRRVH